MNKLIKIFSALALGAAFIVLTSVALQADTIYTYDDPNGYVVPNNNTLCTGGAEVNGCALDLNVTIDMATALPPGLTQSQLGGAGTGTSAPVSWSITLTSFGWDNADSSYDLASVVQSFNSSNPGTLGNQSETPTLDFQTGASGNIIAWAIWAGTSTNNVVYSLYQDQNVASGLFGGAFSSENPAIDGANLNGLGSLDLGPASLADWSIGSSAPPVSPTPEPIAEAIILAGAVCFLAALKRRGRHPAPDAAPPLPPSHFSLWEI